MKKILSLVLFFSIISLSFINVRAYEEGSINLYDSNPKDSTTSKHIKTVMKDYAKAREIEISYTSRWTPFFTNNTISNALQNDTPVE